MHKLGLIQKLVTFSHLVELTTINRWLAASVMGFFYFIETLKESFNLSRLFISLMAIFLVLCYVMAINDCFDVEDDRIKSKSAGKKIIVSEEISIRDALLLALIMLGLGMTISCFISKSFIVIILLITVLSTFYSVPPIRYKQRFPFSTLGEFIGSFLPFLSGYTILGSADFRAVIVSLPFALFSMYWRFHHESVFHEVDRKTGKVTFAVVYGQWIAKTLGYTCLLLSTLVLLILFIFGWSSFNFLFLSGIYLLFMLGFWYWFYEYIPRFVKNVIGPSWVLLFLVIAVIFLVFL